jgi:hypothetical protein
VYSTFPVYGPGAGLDERVVRRQVIIEDYRTETDSFNVDFGHADYNS